MKVWIDKISWVFLFILVLLFGIVQKGCSCDDAVSTIDGGSKESIPEKMGHFNAQIKFISPLHGDVVSGQIDIEVEVQDDDGIRQVAFWVNGAMLGSTASALSGFPANKPHYKLQVETIFLPRGPMSLKAEVTDIYGNKGSKIIQVISRERWAASFGVGTIHQFQVRDDRHLYVRLYRSEDDINNVSHNARDDKVGSVIITTNAVGTASWQYVGAGEEFGDFALDQQHQLFFSSRVTATGMSHLIALGGGEAKWTPKQKIIPTWIHPVQSWRVKGAPILQRGSLWAHLVSPILAGQKSHSAIICLNAMTGQEKWRYSGDNGEKIEILKKPYLLTNGRLVFFLRQVDIAEGSFEIRMLSPDGKILWRKKYKDIRLNVVIQDPRNQYFYIGVERQEKGEVVASSVFCMEPSTGNACWKNETKKDWPSQLTVGNKLLISLQRPPDGTNVVSALQLSNGKKLWSIPFKNHHIVGFQSTENDSFIVFAEKLDANNHPLKMWIESFDAYGKSKWKYLHEQFFPKKWLFSEKEQGRLWVIVRNNEDKIERFGSRILALDRNGKRLFLFGQENRRFHQLQFIPANNLYVSSFLKENARVHQLIAKEK